MKRLGVVLTGCMIALAASFLLARVHPFGDAGLHGTRDTVLPVAASLPTEVRAVLSAKCADCHSMQTRPVFYSSLAPASWLMERDVLDGRRHMNLSLWDTYSADQQQTLKAEIEQQAKTRKMPLPQYRMIHWNTRVTDADVQILSNWARETPSAETISTTATGVGDPMKGKQVFEKRCTGCHSLEQDREGPRLQGLFGRRSGEVPGFPYSDALKKANILWDQKSLDQWLTDPDTLVPGNNMGFHVAKPDERRDLIRFLQQSAANPGA